MPLAVVDTDVLSIVHIDTSSALRRGLPVEEWTRRLVGVGVVISFQTRAEVLSGTRSRAWSERRVADAVARLDQFPTIPPDDEVIDAYARLTAECRQIGHALHQKVHTADRWVAASALAKDLPLIAADQIYRNAPGLQLL